MHSKHSLLRNQYYNAAFPTHNAMLPIDEQQPQQQEPSAWKESKSTKPIGFSKYQGHNQTNNER